MGKCWGNVGERVLTVISAETGGFVASVAAESAATATAAWT